jgi:hypothetical protein
MADTASPDVAALVANALQLTEERLKGAPPGGPLQAMLSSIRNQLVFMRDTVAAGRSPTIQEKNSLNLHVIAVREFDDEPEYRGALTGAAYYFKKL